MHHSFMNNNATLWEVQMAHISIEHSMMMHTIPANQLQTTHSGSSDSTQTAWKMLPNTPTYGPGAAVLAGNLLAVGARETCDGGASKKTVYMYLPSAKSWIYIGDTCSTTQHCSRHNYNILMFKFVHCIIHCINTQ